MPLPAPLQRLLQRLSGSCNASGLAAHRGQLSRALLLLLLQGMLLLPLGMLPHERLPYCTSTATGLHYCTSKQQRLPHCTSKLRGPLPSMLLQHTLLLLLLPLLPQGMLPHRKLPCCTSYCTSKLRGPLPSMLLQRALLLLPQGMLPHGRLPYCTSKLRGPFQVDVPHPEKHLLPRHAAAANVAAAAATGHAATWQGCLTAPQTAAAA
jgi:hypothetical protein